MLLPACCQFQGSLCLWVVLFTLSLGLEEASLRFRVHRENRTLHETMTNPTVQETCILSARQWDIKDILTRSSNVPLTHAHEETEASARNIIPTWTIGVQPLPAWLSYHHVLLWLTGSSHPQVLCFRVNGQGAWPVPDEPDPKHSCSGVLSVLRSEPGTLRKTEMQSQPSSHNNS